MKNFVKDTVGHFTVLIDHATREYEPSLEHILKRMILPLWNGGLVGFKGGGFPATWSAPDVSGRT